MRKNIFKVTGILAMGLVLLNSCSKKNPPLVYFPDMYFPVAYDPLQKAEDPYSKHENEVPLFASREGQTALAPVEGTIPQNREGIIVDRTPKNIDEYNAMYDASRQQNISPLDPANRENDISRGKILYDRTCAACHGTGGDGQGPIVQSGAYSGVPNYADRELTIGSVHFVLENGRNAMGSYAGQLTPGDRWRVALYVMSEFKKNVAVLDRPTTNANATAIVAPSNRPTPAAANIGGNRTDPAAPTATQYSNPEAKSNSVK